MARKKTAEPETAPEPVEPSIDIAHLDDEYVRLTVVPSGRLRDTRTGRTYRSAVCNVDAISRFEVAQ